MTNGVFLFLWHGEKDEMGEVENKVLKVWNCGWYKTKMGITCKRIKHLDAKIAIITF